MVLRNIDYFVNGKKKRIKARVCRTILDKFIGLMFKKSSPPLIFEFGREKKLSIHSFFCVPFRAV
ncbi:hypothetical protein D6829_01470, partial [Candidatus Pacearchaeota archaeon]